MLKLRTILLKNPLLSLIRESKGMLLEGIYENFKRLITQQEPTFYILVGSPRTGKTYIFKKYLQNKLHNYKYINPDDISKFFTSDPNDYKRGSTRLSINSATLFFSTQRKDNASIVYDSTGSDIKRLISLSTFAKQQKYKVVIINVFAPLDTTMDRNLKTDRYVDERYLMQKWDEAQSYIKLIWENIRPNIYFVVVNYNRNQFWYEFDGNKIKRK